MNILHVNSHDQHGSRFNGYEMQNVINDILDYKDSKMTGWKHKAKK